MDSIIPGDSKEKCFICRKYGYTEEHHIFGASDRKWSEKFGLKVHLCVDHHKGRYGVHGMDGAKLAAYLHETGQEAFEEKHTREEFRQYFRKSYL